MRKKVEWSDKRWKEFIVKQRKRMWLPDTVEKLAKWLDLKQGMKVEDMTEATIQDLVFKYPLCLPISEIDESCTRLFLYVPN